MPNLRVLGNFEKQAYYYDLICEAQGKDYEKESNYVHALIQKYKLTTGVSLLDAGCGTCGHYPFLKNWYKYTGLDYGKNMLEVASKKYPEIKLHHSDILYFNFKQRYDVITCLFSVIGDLVTVEKMRKGILNLSKHLKKGGVLILEPWFEPDKWGIGRLSSVYVNKNDIKISRMSISGRKGNVAILKFHFLVGESGRITHFTEVHRLGLFTHEQYMDAFLKAGLTVHFEPYGITGRGVYIGIKK